MNFGTKGCMYNCGDECTGECIKVETKTKMSKEKEIGRRSYQGQIITKDGKFYGYPSGDGSTLDRAWTDNVAEAIIWNTKLDDVTKVFCPSDMSLNGAELKNITKTIVITEDEKRRNTK